jgi:hypothetical protein
MDKFSNLHPSTWIETSPPLAFDGKAHAPAEPICLLVSPVRGFSISLKDTKASLKIRRSLGGFIKVFSFSPTQSSL